MFLPEALASANALASRSLFVKPRSSAGKILIVCQAYAFVR